MFVTAQVVNIQNIECATFFCHPCAGRDLVFENYCFLTHQEIPVSASLHRNDKNVLMLTILASVS